MNYNLFDKEVYINRRRILKKNVGSGLILLLGNEDSSMNYADNCYPFRQDSTFLYYFGLDLPGLAAIIDAATGNEILFGRNPGMDDIIWTGPLPSLQDLAVLVGIAITRPHMKLESTLQAAKSKGQSIHFLPPYRPENKIKLAEWLGISPLQLCSDLYPYH